MARPNLNRVEFVKSAASSAQFVQSPMPRVAFAGKSNVGKSSVINRLLNRKNFARVGSEPGKTVHVNYFLIDERAYFIEVIEAKEEQEGMTYPRLQFEHSPAPDQYDPEASEHSGSIFEEMMGEFGEFDGDDSYDDEY